MEQIDYEKYEGHTPGPWFADMATDASEAVVSGARRSVCVVSDKEFNVPRVEFDANILLVTDAPLLLQACRERDERIRKLEQVVDRLAIIGRREHMDCEDCYYSCPKHPNCCRDDVDYECTCGADETNAAIDEVLKAGVLSEEKIEVSDSADSGLEALLRMFGIPESAEATLKYPNLRRCSSCGRPLGEHDCFGTGYPYDGNRLCHACFRPIYESRNGKDGKR